MSLATYLQHHIYCPCNALHTDIKPGEYTLTNSLNAALSQALHFMMMFDSVMLGFKILLI